MTYFILISTNDRAKETNNYMERKLNQEAVVQYSQTFSAQVLRHAYQHRDYLSGQEILSLTSSKQVNFFIVKEIFFQWKKEVTRLESPYFNYSHPEVQSALSAFMDTLSQHISVDEAHLCPLLEKSIADSLYLILAPLQYFREALVVARPNWTLNELSEHLKYIRVNRFLLENLIEKLQSSNEGTIVSTRIDQLLNEIYSYAAHQAEDPAPYLQQLKEYLDLQVSALYADNATETQLPPDLPAEEVTEIDDKEERRTLNDFLIKPERPSLADQHQQRKIDRLASSISVNQKFMFTRELFNNDTSAFTQAVQQLDAQNTYAEAVNLIRRDYAPAYRWRMDSEEVVEFMELIAKRF